MLSSLTLARPYSQAIFDFAHEYNMLEKWELMLIFAKNILQSKIMVSLLHNINCIESENLAEIFISIANHGFDCFFQNFIRIMVENKRLYLLPFVLEGFLFLCRQNKLIVKVKIITAYVLDSDQLSKIVSIIEKKLLCKVDAVCKLDQTIIGGLIISFNDIVIDGSVKSRVEQLKNTILQI